MEEPHRHPQDSPQRAQRRLKRPPSPPWCSALASPVQTPVPCCLRRPAQLGRKSVFSHCSLLVSSLARPSTVFGHLRRARRGEEGKGRREKVQEKGPGRKRCYIMTVIPAVERRRPDSANSSRWCWKKHRRALFFRRSEPLTLSTPVCFSTKNNVEEVKT